ncbi:MAG: RNA polymerase sigma-70 factor [Tannerella sp.]|jgi:RNA polymerase sigma-70 factor (ECF subfamily)|nr:RNA polymerase sigma-70 factor [Tannerella sp.]
MKNEAAFERIYTLYFARLVRFADEYVQSKEDAENIVQDVFLYLLKQKYPIETVLHIQPFLFELVKRKCIDFLRRKVMMAEKKQNMQDTGMEEYRYNMYAVEAFDGKNADDEALFHRLEEAIQSLPPQCREVFLLCKREGWSHKTVAGKFNISISTVNNHIVQAMKKLKERFDII